jgi:hypothetical protein
MIHLTKEKLEEMKISDFIKDNINEVSKNKNFKLFALEDKNLGSNAIDEIELIAHPDHCNLSFI